ncbi:MAG TPA: hypothetical protein VKU82_02630 [Planctomycetaceae bacterium]|nr:hypothetical protein [Planctomycetaceae bacterium]
MIGYLTLMLFLAALIGLASYWISWDIEDARTRPGLAAALRRDCAHFLTRSQHAAPAATPNRQARASQPPAVADRTGNSTKSAAPRAAR